MLENGMVLNREIYDPQERPDDTEVITWLNLAVNG